MSSPQCSLPTLTTPTNLDLAREKKSGACIGAIGRWEPNKRALLEEVLMPKDIYVIHDLAEGFLDGGLKRTANCLLVFVLECKITLNAVISESAPCLEVLQLCSKWCMCFRIPCVKTVRKMTIPSEPAVDKRTYADAVRGPHSGQKSAGMSLSYNPRT